MFSKKAILGASVYLLGDEEIDEEEFLAIYEIAMKKRQHPYKQYERIDDVLDTISPEEFETEFRFGITELPLLLRALKIPEMFTCANGTVLFRNGRTVDCIETFFLPMSSLGYDSSLWSFSARAELNLKRGDQLYLHKSWILAQRSRSTLAE